jgi:hypothetical protein
MTDDPLDAALYFAHRGWPVFPCHEPAASGCSCRRPECSSPAKHPRTRKGFRDATTDPETIARWWRQWPIRGDTRPQCALAAKLDLDFAVLDDDHLGKPVVVRIGEFNPPCPAGARTVGADVGRPRQAVGLAALSAPPCGRYTAWPEPGASTMR